MCKDSVGLDMQTLSEKGALRAAVTAVPGLARIRTRSHSLSGDEEMEDSSTPGSAESDMSPKPRSPLRRVAEATIHTGIHQCCCQHAFLGSYL